MLKLRRGRVASVDSPGEQLTELLVEVGLESRPAIAYPSLTGPVEVGDEVLMNVEAKDLGLGSGGFDVVYANLSRECEGDSESSAHVMKLNYTPLQHSVKLLEEGLTDLDRTVSVKVGVLALHGQLAAATYAFKRALPEARIGYIQTVGGALPGALSRTVAQLKERELLAGHVTVAPCFGGDHESATTAAAIHAVDAKLGWDAALAGPGPGIQGSASALGHGGMAALDSLHAGLGLGAECVLVPRISGGDRRERHRGLSHHTAAILKLLLQPVTVALPGEGACITEGDSAAAGGAVEGTGVAADDGGGGGVAAGGEVAAGNGVSEGGEVMDAVDERIQAVDPAGRHSYERIETESLLNGYREAGLPDAIMGRSIDEDQEFFLAALAGGAVLGEKVAQGTERSG